MSDTNERSVGSDGSVVAWAVVCGDCVDSMFTDRDKAVEWACRLIPPWQIVPLYRAPTLTDAERSALHWFSHYGLPEHHAATLRGLLGRLK